jgi:hypothetical protein
LDYWIDRFDRIVDVSSDWSEFARANGADHLTPEAVRGRPLWDFIGDPTTRHIWEILLHNARRGVTHPMTLRCDAPDTRRLVKVVLSAERDLVRVTSTVERVTPRFAEALLDPGRKASGELLTCCSWCKKFRSPSGPWVEVEVLMQEMKLFERETLPPITHSICPACERRLAAEMGALENVPVSE